MTVFDIAFAQTVGQEGGYTADPTDSGNWTGGRVGAGVCRGTKWGISAASYPNLDIAGLTLMQAKAIYQRDFWEKLRGDALPPALAVLAFDAAVNAGVQRAAIWIQGAAAVATDGILGPETMAALAAVGKDSAGVLALCCEFQARRLDFMACLSTWQRFGLGWARRICLTLQAAITSVTAV